MKQQLIIVLLLLFSLFGSRTLYGYVANHKTPVQDTTDYVRTSATLAKQASAGIHNAGLYNQLGLSYYHQGKTGQAVVAFLRALRLNSSDKAARNNLDFALTHSLDRELYPEQSFLSVFFGKIFYSANLNLLAILMLVMLILTALCLHWLLHLPYSADKAVPVMWSLICGLVFLVFATLLILKFQGYNDNKQAVVIASEINGYSGPGSQYAKIFTIHDGLILQITRIDKDWALVTLPNGSAGWIPTEVIEKVKLK